MSRQMSRSKTVTNRRLGTSSLSAAQLAGLAPLPPYEPLAQRQQKQTFKDVADDIRQLPFVSYGYPVLVAIIGLAMLNSFLTNI